MYKKVKINLMKASFNVRTNGKQIVKVNCEKPFSENYNSENFTTAGNQKIVGVTWNKKSMF